MINGGGKPIAAIRPEVTTDDSTKFRKFAYHSITEKYLSESELFIPFYPNTDRFVSFRINMTAATVTTKKDDDYVRVPLSDLLKAE
ncbi:MAG: hypothetical protein ACI8XO_002133 [Verrucomicrobiales bacterium]